MALVKINAPPAARSSVATRSVVMSAAPRSPRRSSTVACSLETIFIVSTSIPLSKPPISILNSVGVAKHHVTGEQRRGCWLIASRIRCADRIQFYADGDHDVPGLARINLALGRPCRVANVADRRRAVAGRVRDLFVVILN